MFAPSARVFQEVLHRVLDAAQLPKVKRNGKERPYIRFHDLRHTFASHWVTKGGDLYLERELQYLQQQGVFR
jgi:integrase